LVGRLSRLSRADLGVFRGRAAVEAGISRKRLVGYLRAGVIERVLPDTYRMTAVAPTREQFLRAALLWAGDDSAAADRSAGVVYRLEGVTTADPEIVVPATNRVRHPDVRVHRVRDGRALMVRTHRGFRVTGVEATLVALAASLDGEAFEIACEDARRRRLTSVGALRAYLDRFGTRGMPGITATRQLLDELDPVHPSKSTLEVKMRRLLVVHGFTDFVREFPLTGNGRTRFYDFAFQRQRVILETNGRRWHDDPIDYEDDHDKWSIPGRLGYRLVFATWDKVTQHPDELLRELTVTLAA
jgi:very-short-patch-repair endonuclease